MNHFALDASALGKRYVPERGSTVMDRLLEDVDHARLHCLSIGTLETLSIIVRARNKGVLDQQAANDAMDLLDDEVVGGGVQIIGAGNDLVFSAAPLIKQHSVNSTDAILLRAILDLRAAMRMLGDNLVLVSSDGRLLRAAAVQGSPIFKSETEDIGALQALANAG